MKVTFLVSDIHSTVLGAVIVLAQYLRSHCEVQIVGPDLGQGVCPLYRDSFPYTVVPCPRIYRIPDYFRESARLMRAVDGDLVVAVKAFGDTVPLAWWMRKFRGRKMAVYLDEWDGALMAQRSPGERWRRWISHAHHPTDDVYCPWVERLIPGADLVLSTSTALQRRFGGYVLPLGADTDLFRPQAPDGTRQLRHALGLEGYRVLGFGGVVRPHKGVETILEALCLLGDARMKLMVIGPENEHVRELKARPDFGRFLLCTGAKPKADMPRYLDVCDLIALPLENTPLAQTQTPCKIFEAMAMAKPIIGTTVADVPLILQGCGETVPPGDPAALADAIRRVLADNPAELGRRAREKCLREYGHEVVGDRLRRLVADLLAKGEG